MNDDAGDLLLAILIVLLCLALGAGLFVTVTQVLRSRALSRSWERA